MTNLNLQIDGEVAKALEGSQLNVEDLGKTIRVDVEKKYASMRSFFERGLKRTKIEEFVHQKQKKYNKYEKLFK